MIAIDIPGHRRIEAMHLVLDYNGTLAIDGRMIEGTRQLLDQLSHHLTIHVLTADTFGTSKDELKTIKCTLIILNDSRQDEQKEQYVSNLPFDNVITIGNGQNDRLMFAQSALSIMVIQQEGAFTRLVSKADIVCLSIIDALNLIMNPLRIIATLRK